MTDPGINNIPESNGKIDLIQGFSSLFETAAKDFKPGKVSEIDPAGSVGGPLANDGDGIRDGATLLISGPPGSGKTTFALAMVRALMAGFTRKYGSNKDRPGGRKAIAYYISSEVSESKLTETYSSFGWFKDKKREAVVPGAFSFQIEDPNPDETNFYVITPMPEVDRPVPSPEELVNRIFNRIAHTLSPSEAPRENARIYVIVDSISALLKGCANTGEERRQTHEIMYRLRDRFGEGNPALTILLAEQDHSGSLSADGATGMGTVPSVEDYLTDIVFRLYSRPLPLGRRARVLEVVKSQGVNMILGEHTWQILTEDNYQRILRHDGMRAAIKLACQRCDVPSDARIEIDNLKAGDPVPHVTEQRWAGIIIFPRPQLQRLKDGEAPLGQNANRFHPPLVNEAPSQARGESERGEGKKSVFVGEADSRTTLTLGTKGLELEFKRGTMTLIAGPVGSGKTTLCRQFLRTAQANGYPAVLISFDIAPAGENDSEFKFLDFTQYRFDLNVLTAHINWMFNVPDALSSKVPAAIAFDGLHEWISMFDATEAARMLEALIVTVRRSRHPPAVVMTYASGVDEVALESRAIGINADNILVIRQVAINDRLRRIIYALKGENLKAQLEVPQELVFTRKRREPHAGRLGEPGPNTVEQTDPIGAEAETQDSVEVIEVVQGTLDSYTGLLGHPGDLKPAQVLLLLFAENKVEQDFNRSLYERLQQQHKGRLKIIHSKFSRSEIGSTFDLISHNRSPGESASVNIQSVDEWWPGAAAAGEFLFDLRDVWDDLKSVGWYDYWLFDMEKAKGDPNDSATGIFAVPASMDFGMFCINLHVWQMAKRDAGKNLSARELWRKIIAEVPRLWARREKLGDVSWFTVQESEPDNETVLEYALRVHREAGIVGRQPVFSLDLTTRETCVCGFLEFAWAFGADEAMLASASDSEEERQRSCAISAILFLQFMVIEGLMPEQGGLEFKDFKNSNDGVEPLFSRHFYSTLMKHGEDVPREGKRMQPMALPFMPIGLGDDNQAFANALADVKTRLRYWLKRAKRYLGAADNGSRPADAKLQEMETWSNSTSLTSHHSHHEPQFKEAVRQYTMCRNLLIEWSTEPVFQESADARSLEDLIELASWAAFRLQLLAGERDGRFLVGHSGRLGQAMESIRTKDQYLPDLSRLKFLKPVHTGYVCTGSWMYGVSKRSRAPLLQAQLLRDLTSLDSSEERGGHAGPERFLPPARGR